MALPVRQHRDQQVRAAQQRRIRGGRTAERDVVSAAGAPVATIEIERLGAQTGVPRVVVQRIEQLGLLGETARRLDVDLDDARVRGHRQRREPGVGRRAVALDDDRGVDRCSRVLDHLDDRQILLEFGGRRQEHVQHVSTLLGDQRGARHEGGGTDVGDGAAQCFYHIVGQRIRAYGGVGFVEDGRRTPRQRVERESQPSGRGAGREHQASAPRRPACALPRRAVLGTAQRQDECRGVGDRRIQRGEQFTTRLGGIVGRLDVGIGVDRLCRGTRPRRRTRRGECGVRTRVARRECRQLAHPHQRILECGHHLRAGQPQRGGERRQQFLGRRVGTGTRFRSRRFERHRLGCLGPGLPRVASRSRRRQIG